ncbi:MAG: response regulator [Oscillospiraceae bacterium]|nr:response regulator [Oscillospiraceae bacterium]
MNRYDGERYYHSVPGLLVPLRVDYEKVHFGINRYIDVIPELSEKLENDFADILKGKRWDFFINNMEILTDMLRKIYARSLETDAQRLIRSITNDNCIEIAQKNMNSFIRNLHSLSIAMQRAQDIKDVKRTLTFSSIESLANATNNIIAVYNLINDNAFMQSKDFITELQGFMPEEKGLEKLLSLLSSGSYTDARIMAKALKDKYVESLEELAATDLSKTVLVVDDMAEILSFVSSALKSRYKTIAVTGGKAAIKFIERQRPDLFILDIDMPEMDGFELAEIIRNKAEHVKTPLIFLTGNCTREYVTQAIKVGGNDFIVKPTTHEALLTTVGKYFERTQ